MSSYTILAKALKPVVKQITKSAIKVTGKQVALTAIEVSGEVFAAASGTILGRIICRNIDRKIEKDKLEKSEHGTK